MVHQIFTKFAIVLVTGQVKVLAWSRYDAEKQDHLVDTSKLFSSVGWNLVNWNVERTRICLSESTPSYGVDSSFTFSFLRVLPEPNLQESEESRGSHHLFSLMNHYGLVWFADFPYLCPLKVNDLLHSAIWKQTFIALVCIIFAKWSKQLAVSAEKPGPPYIMNLKTNAYE